MYLIEELTAEFVTTTIRLVLSHPFTVLNIRVASDWGSSNYVSYIYPIVSTVSILDNILNVNMNVLCIYYFYER